MTVVLEGMIVAGATNEVRTDTEVTGRVATINEVCVVSRVLVITAKDVVSNIEVAVETT